MKIVLIPNERPSGLSGSADALYDALISLSKKVREAREVSDKSKEDTLLIIQTFQFILINQAYINEVVNGAWENETEVDKAKGIIRASNQISFHVNGYHAGSEACAALINTIDQFISAANIAVQYQALNHFIQACEYNHQTGCMEERISKALTVSAHLQANEGVPELNSLMQEIMGKYNSADQEDWKLFLLKIKKDVFDSLGNTISYDGKIQTLTWNVIEIFLQSHFKVNDHDELLVLKHCFSDNQNYLDFITFSRCNIKTGFYGMTQHLFSCEQQALYFKEVFLDKLDCFKTEAALLNAHVKNENLLYVVRLTQAQLAKIKETTVNLPTVKPEAEPQDDSSFYAKTITGFADPDAWCHAIRGMTRQSDSDKPPFRDEKKLKENRYRVRVNPDSQCYEVHDAKDSNESLHKAEKARRKNAGIAPLPPHQSFTYYDPQDMNFRPGFFQPNNLSEMGKGEIIGVRVKAKGVFLNRIIVTDQGTHTVFYGFKTKKEAIEYQNELEKNQHWAKNFAELKERQLAGRINEIQLRASWLCDDDSGAEVLIYPPRDSLAGKYMAILYKLDLEKHLAKHSEFYRKAPFHWTPEYQVPISFWSNSNTKPDFYDEATQKKDLEKPATSAREHFLKTAIAYMKRTTPSADFIFDKTLITYFKQNLKNLATLADNFGLLNWLGSSLPEFYELLFAKIPVEEIRCFLSLPGLFESKQLNNIRNAAVATEKRFAEIKLEAEKRFAAGRIAAGKGHTETVKALCDAALRLKEKNPDDTTLKEMLLAECPGYGAAYAIRLAARNGHTETVKALCDAASSLAVINGSDTTLKEMLLAAHPGEGSAHAVRIAAQNGHTETVKALCDAALKLKEKNPDDTTLKEMLLSLGLKKLGSLQLFIPPEIFYQMLIKSTKEEREKILSIGEKIFSKAQRDDIVTHIAKQADPTKKPTEVAEVYAGHAGFFSYTNKKIKKHTELKEHITLFQERAKKNFTGASMMTLLDMASADSDVNKAINCSP
ncbi:MAG: ankyrin repeat domain-containing protein [Gammaproteobacteria bacterium]|nr:ankyrin repeat domain-containing protein [Gammaproteobacteria bacterium]